MLKAQIPLDEAERFKTLEQLNLLDTPLEKRFERITRVLCQVLNVPMAAFSLIGHDRQWLKSEQGLGITETSREEAFCSHVILSDDILHVPDATKDERFFDHPAVTGEGNIRFYVGSPIHAPNGHRIGSLCAVDTKPRGLGAQELQSLKDLASLVETELRSLQLSAEQTMLVEKLDAAQKLALVDPLTRLWNRRGIFELLKRRWSEASRSGEAIVVVMADIDHFKNINDTYGHSVGDTVLQAVARNLLMALRDEDIIGRIGGEEFLLVLKGCEPGNLKQVVERIRESVISTKILVPGNELGVTLSFGVATEIPAPEKKYEDLIDLADKALYSAKNSGRNCVHMAGDLSDGVM